MPAQRLAPAGGGGSRRASAHSAQAWVIPELPAVSPSVLPSLTLRRRRRSSSLKWHVVIAGLLPGRESFGPADLQLGSGDQQSEASQPVVGDETDGWAMSRITSGTWRRGGSLHAK